MHSENYKAEIVRGASVGTALGIVIGHRCGLLVGLLVGFISAIVMANPILVWQAILEIASQIKQLSKTTGARMSLKGEHLLTKLAFPKRKEWVKTAKDLGCFGIVLGTVCLTITQPFLQSVSGTGVSGILFATFVPVILAFIFLIALVTSILESDGPFHDLVSTKNKLLWPLCKALNSGVYEGKLFEWLLRQTLSKKLRIGSLLDWLEGRAEVLRDWFKTKYDEDGSSEKEISLGRIVALLGTVLFVVFGLSVGVWLIILFSILFIGLTLLTVILDIPVMIFLKIATSPALAAGEGTVLAIFIEGVTFQSFDSSSGGDWLRLALFSVLGAVSGLTFYALRRRLGEADSVIKPA